MKNARIKNTHLFVVSAPSGAGKTTLGKQVLSSLPHLVRSVSVTTRKRRKGERNGKDYYFVTKDEFRRAIAKGTFLEYACVFGEYYGTPREFVLSHLRKGRDVLLTIDVQGAMKIRRCLRKESIFIFILPPSMSILRKRLLERRTDTRAQVKKRLDMAREEIHYLEKYDYSIVNHKLGAAVEALRSIIVAERLKIQKALRR